MKGTLFFSALFFVISQAFGQFESVEPLSVNTDLSWGQSLKTKALSTFDSTFIYKSDTLSLPFLTSFHKIISRNTPKIFQTHRLQVLKNIELFLVLQIYP